MKARIIGAALLVAVLAVAAYDARPAPPSIRDASITVWLQVDAQSGWPDVVAAANAAFQKQHPGVDVNVQYQNWGTHLGKFDATLAGGNAPDVIEMGNTEMTKYMAAGAFQDISRQQVDVRQLGHLARGPRRLRPVQRQALRRPVLRRLARRHVPHRPLPAGRHQGRRRASAQFTADAKQAEREVRQEGLLAGLHRRHRLVRRDELRLRLRRQDRRAGERQVEGPARLAEVDRRPDRVQELLPRRLAGEQDDRRERGRPRTACTRTVTPARWSAPAGSPAASATSTRARRRSS